MKQALIVSLIVAQLPLAPLAAATIEDDVRAGPQHVGTFAGARLRVPFGGRQAGKPSAGLGIAGVTHSQSPEGRIAARFSEGVQLGFSADRKLGLTVGGKRVGQPALGAQQDDQGDDKDGGVPTWALIAGGVLIASGIGVALLVDAMNDASE